MVLNVPVYSTVYRLFLSVLSRLKCFSGRASVCRSRTRSRRKHWDLRLILKAAPLVARDFTLCRCRGITAWFHDTRGNKKKSKRGNERERERGGALNPDIWCALVTCKSGQSPSPLHFQIFKVCLDSRPRALHRPFIVYYIQSPATASLISKEYTLKYS